MSDTRTSWVLFLCLLSLTASPVSAAELARVEIPIREVPLPNTYIVYSIPIKVGNTVIEAGFDTGSTGLRILPGTLAAGDVAEGEKSRPYVFNAGVTYNGVFASGTLGIGPLSGTVRLQSVQTVTCSGDNPNCAAKSMKQSNFGISGAFTTGRFRAVLGVGNGPSDIGNPFFALGVKRWIVHLPRPGEGAGFLVLNPSDSDMKDFGRFDTNSAMRPALNGLHDALIGCAAYGEKKFEACGPIMLDSGLNGVRIVNSSDQVNAPILLGLPRLVSPMRLTFASSSIKANTSFTTMPQTGYLRLTLEKNDTRKMPAIFAGIEPYFAFDVLYDLTVNQMGLRPRPSDAKYSGGSITAR